MAHAYRAPVTDFTGKNARQLVRAQLAHRVVGVHDHRHAINGDHLLGLGAFQVAQAVQGHQFSVLDRSRGGRQVRFAVFQCGEAGGRAMGIDFNTHRLPIWGTGNYLLLIGLGAGFDLYLLEALIQQHCLGQRRAQLRADGVGALDTQQGGLSVGGQGQNEAGEAK